MLPRIAIVIVSFNTLEFTRTALSYVDRNTDLPYQIIVVDNASSDGSAEYLREWERENGSSRTLIQNDWNQGFSRACNQGLDYTRPGEYVCLLNSDVMVPHNWVSRLISHFNDTDRVGAVGPLGSKIGGFQDYARLYGPVSYPYDRWPPGPEFENFAESVYTRQKTWFRTAKVLVGCCLMISPEALNDVGRLDDNLFAAADDFDWSVRARLKGYDLIVAHDVYVWHKCMASTSKLNAGVLEDLRSRSWNYFNHKWKHIFPDNSWNDHFVNDKELERPRFRLLESKGENPVGALQNARACPSLRGSEPAI